MTRNVTGRGRRRLSRNSPHSASLRQRNARGQAPPKYTAIARQHKGTHGPLEEPLRAIVAFEHAGGAVASFQLPVILDIVVPRTVPR